MSVVVLILIPMTAQLLLIDTDAQSWKIPEATREIGRRGLAEARAVLHAIPRRTPADDHEATPIRPAA